MEALCVPKVLLYGVTFFCVKFAVYALLLWMPLFLGHQLGYENSTIADIQSLYEVGVIFGALILGYISDRLHARRSPVIVASALFNTIISLIIYKNYESFTPRMWQFVLFWLGFFLGSMHHFCVVTCPADIGREQKTSRATSTITGIIDGIGTAGSGVGQLVLGTLIDLHGWEIGYLRTLVIVQACALLPTALVLRRELGEIREIRNET